MAIGAGSPARVHPGGAIRYFTRTDVALTLARGATPGVLILEAAAFSCSFRAASAICFTMSATRDFRLGTGFGSTVSAPDGLASADLTVDAEA